MTVVLVALVLALVAGIAIGWTICCHHHKALRFDRDLQEQDAWMYRDALLDLDVDVHPEPRQPGLLARIFHGQTP